MRIRTGLIAFVIALATAACGGGVQEAAAPTTPPIATTPPSPSPTVTPGCTPEGDELQVLAQGIKFDTSCLAAPADTPFTIDFENDDGGVLHNIVIKDGEQFFDGEPFAGDATKTYEVDAIPAGIYTFHCKFHISEMQGQFVVQ
jgi:plastocyanin